MRIQGTYARTHNKGCFPIGIRVPIAPISRGFWRPPLVPVLERGIIHPPESWPQPRRVLSTSFEVVDAGNGDLPLKTGAKSSQIMPDSATNNLSMR